MIKPPDIHIGFWGTVALVGLFLMVIGCIEALGNWIKDCLRIITKQDGPTND